MSVWGDPYTASNLNTTENSQITSLILQVCSLNQLKLGCSEWQDLFHNYGILVHLDTHNQVVASAVQSMSENATHSRNLATLNSHTIHFLKELLSYIDKKDSKYHTIVGKARVTCAALHLMRLFIHEILSTTSQNLKDLLHHSSGRGLSDLLSQVAQFLCLVDQNSNKLLDSVYDVVVNVLELLLVLMSRQVYSIPGTDSTDHSADMFQILFELFAANDNLINYSNTGNPNNRRTNSPYKTSAEFLQVLLNLTIKRPRPPVGSIASYNFELIESVLCQSSDNKNNFVPDSYRIVSRQMPDNRSSKSVTGLFDDTYTQKNQSNGHSDNDALETGSVITTATKSAFHLSTNILLLPFKIFRFAFSAIGRIGMSGYHLLGGNNVVYNEHDMLALNDKHVLWSSDSFLADLSVSLFLLLTHNYRSPNHSVDPVNPFLSALTNMKDQRWTNINNKDMNGKQSNAYSHGNAPMIDLESGCLDNDTAKALSTSPQNDNEYSVTFGTSAEDILAFQQIRFKDGSECTTMISTNYEMLYYGIGKILHTEVGALFLYTLLQTNNSFASFVSVRSDIETLVLPLVKTLYHSTTAMKIFNMKQQQGTDRCYRSKSQVYLVMILLLILSQDASFGEDVFKRNILQNVSWYKERQLKDINLGSVILLCLLRVISHDIGTWHDEFILNNSFAILSNLKNHAVNLHSYASMRIANVTVKYLRHCTKNNEEEDSAMYVYDDVSNALLSFLHSCLKHDPLRSNAHLVYYLTYMHSDLNLLADNLCPTVYSKLEIIQKFIEDVFVSLKQNDATNDADKAMSIIKQASIQYSDNIECHHDDIEEEDLCFLYQEQADSEQFFVPYIWEVIVCVITSALIEWKFGSIKLFDASSDSIDKNSGNSDDGISSYNESDSPSQLNCKSVAGDYAHDARIFMQQTDERAEADAQDLV